MATSPGLSRRTFVVAAGLTALAGCSGKNSTGDPNTLRIAVNKHPLTKPLSTMEWPKQLEKIAGVKIQWQEISADWDQKKSTMLAAGDVPDLIIGTNAITNADLGTYRTLFENLADDLDALPNVKALFAAKPQLKSMATLTTGEIYSIPGYKRFWPTTVTHQYINKQWLDRLGLKVPTTWDELYTVLVAFKEQDANGNGDKDDEIPMDWSPVGTGGFGYFQPSALLGSVGLPIAGGGGQGYFLEDGKVGNFLVDERYKRVIGFLHRCYAAGLISKNVMTQDYSAYQAVGRGSGKVAKVGFSWGWTASDRFGAELADQYVAMPPLLAEAGQTIPVTWTYDSNGENFPSNQIVVSARTGNKQAALKIVNAFYDKEMSLQVLWGDLGKYVKKVSDTEYEVLPPADPKVDPSTWKWTVTIADNGPVWIRDDIEVKLPADLDEAVEQTKPLQKALANMDPDKDVYPFQFIQMKPDDTNQLGLNNTTMLNTAMTKFAEWITKGGVEDQWGQYVQQLQNAGLQKNIDIYQRYYDEYVKTR
ncbi:hypothetical protein ACIBQ1_23620 [Nonomuraea sp. NPDC050153]|uniref:hypothetical protein n=1 Tax=Nonomuraea sp. NPDC050153 TaxID=3364359 RepID=UPI003798803E